MKYACYALSAVMGWLGINIIQSSAGQDVITQGVVGIIGILVIDVSSILFETAKRIGTPQEVSDVDSHKN
jgi:uncharacterized membrane protein YeaQ/YmgE (transglycosylase-associated protein family)